MALPEKLTLEIVTPERRVVSETVDEVVLPGREGYLGVLPGHARLLTTLRIGQVEYRQGKDRHLLSLAWGFAEVLPEKVTVLAEIAERADEIDLERARAKKEEVERTLNAAGPDFDFAAAQDSIEKSIVRIEVATRFKPLPGEPRRRVPRAGRIHTEEPGE